MPPPGLPFISRRSSYVFSPLSFLYALLIPSVRTPSVLSRIFSRLSTLCFLFPSPLSVPSLMQPSGFPFISRRSSCVFSLLSFLYVLFIPSARTPSFLSQIFSRLSVTDFVFFPRISCLEQGTGTSHRSKDDASGSDGASASPYRDHARNLNNRFPNITFPAFRHCKSN